MSSTGDQADGQAAEVLGVGEVVAHDAHLCIGHVLELEVVRAVSQRPQAGHGGAVGLGDETWPWPSSVEWSRTK